MEYNERLAKESSESLEQYKDMIQAMLWLQDLRINEHTLSDIYMGVDCQGRTFWGKEIKIQHKCYNGKNKYGKPKNILLPIRKNREWNKDSRKFDGQMMDSNTYNEFNREYVIDSKAADYLTCEWQDKLYIFDLNVLYMMFSLNYEQFEKGIKEKSGGKGYLIIFDFEKFLKLYYDTFRIRTEPYFLSESVFTKNGITAKKLEAIYNTDKVKWETISNNSEGKA